MIPDPTSQSNFLDIATEHVAFDWNISFDDRQISGSALHTLRASTDGVTEVILDSNDLHIEKAEVAGVPAQWVLKPHHEVMGSALHITLPEPVQKGERVRVKVYYQTAKSSIALQWLDKEQTQGKTFPYLFSQCQPIYARCIAPLQDSSSVKITYSASVTAVLPVLMSARRVSPPADGVPHEGKEIGKDRVTYTYDQPVAMPSYLIAIASGNVRYKSFPSQPGKEWTSGVWAEPQILDAAYWEFSEDTGRFLSKAEDLVAPYAWGVYDLLVLPPSFPYGGMENACLTFVTPSLLVGDRTLVDVVVHELSHSYFGNGITQANSSHFWLNEGWTTWTERLMQQVLHSPAHRGFSYIIGSKSLADDLENYADRPKYQRLVIEFEEGEDPDDAYSTVPYEKGSNFILYLERTLGGLDVFLPYVKDYVKTFTGKSITTQEWKDHLYAFYKEHGGEDKIKALDSIDWNAWFYGEGQKLPVEMEYDTTLAVKAWDLAARWDQSRHESDVGKLDFKANDLEDFDSNQKIVFLEKLSSYSALPSSHALHLATVYALESTPNAEIRSRFYEVVLADPASSAAQQYAPEALAWINGETTGMVIGRMKFCRPTYKSVAKVNKNLAEAAFETKKDAYHPIARKMIEKDLASV